METRKVTFHGADGTALVGVLDSPPDECSQVVVLIHGGMAHKSAFYHKHLGKQLVSRLGLHVFKYDKNNNGESGGDRNFMGGFWQDVDDIGIIREPVV
eukprot:gene21905-31818_t